MIKTFKLEKSYNNFYYTHKGHNEKFILCLDEVNEEFRNLKSVKRIQFIISDRAFKGSKSYRRLPFSNEIVNKKGKSFYLMSHSRELLEKLGIKRGQCFYVNIGKGSDNEISCEKCRNYLPRTDFKQTFCRSNLKYSFTTAAIECPWFKKTRFWRVRNYLYNLVHN